jgi:hypothetical protein
MDERPCIEGLVRLTAGGGSNPPSDTNLTHTAQVGVDAHLPLSWLVRQAEGLVESRLFLGLSASENAYRIGEYGKTRTQ